MDNGSNGTATPDIIPDVIGKIAYDTKLGKHLFPHADAAGLFREFKVNTLTTGANSGERQRQRYGWRGVVQRRQSWD